MMLKILKYENYDEKYHFHCSENETTYTRNMREMHEKFQQFQNNYNPVENENIDITDVIEINLCISWFFDSFQIYHRKTSIFAPLIFTFLNLPPNIRNILGFGTFLLFKQCRT